MKKSIFTILIISFLSLCISYGEEIFEHFTEEYGSHDIKNHTLLVLNYKLVKDNEPSFAQDSIKAKTLAKFVRKQNEKIEEHNQELKEAFEDYYDFKFLIIDEKELGNYPSSEYPYAYKRYPHVKNHEFVAYSRFFINRKDKIIYKDINLYSGSTKGRMGVEKDIVYALNEYLLYDSTQHVTQEEPIKE